MLIIIVAGLFFLAGCDIVHFGFFKGSEDEKNSPTITQAPSEKEPEEEEPGKTSEGNGEDTPEPGDSGEASATPALTPGAENVTPGEIRPTENTELTIYTVNVSTGGPENVTALVPADAEITPQLIVEKVVEAMADRSLDVGIENVTTQGDTVIVSFYKDKAPLSEMGSGYEESILDAIAQSLVDNLEDYNKIIYRAEGEAYTSGHIALGLNEIYLEDK